jgi:hypothetical protein
LTVSLPIANINGDALQIMREFAESDPEALRICEQDDPKRPEEQPRARLELGPEFKDYGVADVEEFALFRAGDPRVGRKAVEVIEAAGG